MVFENQLFHRIKVSKIELTIKFHQMIFGIILRSGKQSEFIGNEARDD